MREPVVRAERVGRGAQVLRVVDVVRQIEGHRSAELRGHPNIDLRTRAERGRVALVPLEIVDEHERRDDPALIAAKSRPRRDVSTAAHGGTTPGAPVAEDVAEIAQRAAHMKEPLVLELPMEVRVKGPIGGQTARRPELPPVEVPERPLKDLVRLLPVQGTPVVPPLLIGAKQKTEIVDLKARRAPHIAGLEA